MSNSHGLMMSCGVHGRKNLHEHQVLEKMEKEQQFWEEAGEREDKKK